MASLPASLAWGQQPAVDKQGSAYEAVAGDAAWCWFSDPRAVYYKGRREQIYFSYISSVGDVVIGARDQRSGETETFVLHQELEIDDHDVPAILILPDGRLLVFYTEHNGRFFLRRSKNPEDIGSWEKERILPFGGRTTYAHPVMLSEEDNRIYLFWRGSDWRPTFSVSDDGGGSWAAPQALIAGEGIENASRPYLKVATDNRRRIDFVFTDGHPAKEARNSVYHFYYEAGAFYKTGGRLIGSAGVLPIKHEMAGKVYDAAAGGARAWISDIALDDSGRPAIVYVRFPRETDHYYHYARWNGEKWIDEQLCRAGGWMPATRDGEKIREPHYSGGIALDHEDVNKLYLSREVEGVFEIEHWSRAAGRYLSSADVSAWRRRPLTRRSGADNVRPVAVSGYPGEEAFVLWMNGTYYHYTEFNTSLRIAELAPLSGQSAAPPSGPAIDSARRRYLEEILAVNIDQDHRHDISRRVTLQDSTWLDWLHRTGELPPDFSKMRSIPFLPEPLVLQENGREVPIESREQWRRKREWIKKEFQRWISGRIPPPPEDFKVKVLSEREEEGSRVQLIQLNFGPGYKGRMTFELMIPGGAGPFPVYMTQWTHRSWAQLAVRRGYIGVVYAGADSRDDTQGYQALYPAYDFTCLMRRAWGASRVIDYLMTRPEVNKKQIAITGHSRNGKQSLWAAAFDERITAVVSSSSGTGGITPWRYSDPQYCTQTLDDICSNAAHWFHPRLRFFFGREDKLPVDQNLLISLIAPRGLLFHYSVMEQQLNPWVNEQVYHSVKKVYDFLGAGNNIGLFPRAGEHAVAARDLERCIDFLDKHFRRKDIPWENKLYYDTTLPEASAHPVSPVVLRDHTDTAGWEEQRKLILEKLDWLTGEAPPGVKPAAIQPTTPSRIDWMDRVTGRPRVEGAKVVHLGPYDAPGDHLAASLYLPVDEQGNKRTRENGSIPVIIYLHQYAHAHGYALGYSARGGRGNSHIFQKFVDNGFAVMALDMIGFGARMKEAQFFYRRFPAWSLMGKMIHDVRSCIDALVTIDFIDSDRIFILGNTLGGSVGLMAAAGDQRIAGLGVVAAFSPWRASNDQYESLRAYAKLHKLLPRLRQFTENPTDTPVDFGEIIACIAPRPLMIIAPRLDRHSDPQAVQVAMRRVENLYDVLGAADSLCFSDPPEINRLTPAMLDDLVNFFNDNVNDK